MNPGIEMLYCYTDRSVLTRVWEKYYTDLGLSYSKKLNKVIQRVKKGKLPIIK